MQKAAPFFVHEKKRLKIWRLKSLPYISTMKQAQHTMTRSEKIEALKSEGLKYRYTPIQVPAPGDNDPRVWTRHELIVHNAHGACVFIGCERSELACYQAAQRAIRKRHMDWRPRK